MTVEKLIDKYENLLIGIDEKIEKGVSNIQFKSLQTQQGCYNRFIQELKNLQYMIITYELTKVKISGYNYPDKPNYK